VDAHIHAVSRNPQVGNGRIRWWQGDLSDFQTTESLLKQIRPDIIFQLTTHGWGAPGLEHVQPALHNDLIPAVNVLTVATQLKVSRIILTRSLDEPQADIGDGVPPSPYAAAKWAGGAYARMFHQLYETPVVFVRIFMAYGPGQPVQKLIPYTMVSLLRGDTPTFSSGQRLIDWVYVDDVIRGLLTSAQASNVEGSTIDIGSGTLVSVRTVVERIVTLVKPEVQPLFADRPRPIEPVRVANVTDSYRRVGWRASTSMDDGLEMTLKWFRAQIRNNSHDSSGSAFMQTTWSPRVCG
jgi:nucleoside-diphosphate-sugar epimerase